MDWIDDEQRQNLMRRQADGMRAMSPEEMAKRQSAAAYGARNSWPTGINHARGQQAMSNFWRDATDSATIAQLPPKPRPTLWARFMKWIGA